MIWWTVIRVAGLVAWFLAATSIAIGAASRSGLLGRRIRLRNVVTLHRTIAGGLLASLVVHVVALFPESHADLPAAAVLVPGASEWRTAGMAARIVALWLVLAVHISSLLARRLSLVAWRRLHLLAYPVFGLATYHALAVGTDVGHGGLELAGALMIWLLIVVMGARVGVRAGQASNGTGPAPSTVISRTRPTTVVMPSLR